MKKDENKTNRLNVNNKIKENKRKDSQKIKKNIIILVCFIIYIFTLVTPTYCIKQNTLKKQENEFKISEFIEKSKEYSNEFFEDIEIQELLNNAIKGEVDNSTIIRKIINLLGKEINLNVKVTISVFVIILIHSILKSVSESLEHEEIGKLIYYAQYIMIVTIIMANFTDVIKLVQDTANNLIGFMNLLVPLLIALMLYTGSITTSTVLEPVILFMVNLVGNLIRDLIIPFILVYTSLVIISKISDKVQISNISKLMKSSIVWILGFVLTIFVGVVSLEGTLSSSVDGITAKTTKTIVSSTIPVVGKILGDAVDSVLGCGVILKNAIGIVGVVIIIGICVIPIIKIFVISLGYKILSIVVQPIGDSKVVGLLEQVGDIFKILLGILCAISFMLIIGTTLVLRMSNASVMFR